MPVRAQSWAAVADRRAHPQGGRRARRRHAGDAARWAQTGVIPERRTAAGELDRRRRSPTRGSSRRLRERGHTLEQIREASRRGPARLRLRRGAVPRAARRAASLERGRRGDRPRAGADRAVLDQHRPPGQRARATLTDEDARRRCATSPSVLDAGLPAGRLPPARARVRAGAGPDRRRRGAAVPHLRARAADARGRARACRWPRRWSTSRATCCRSPRRSWTTCTSASSSTTSSRTWSATWRSSSTASERPRPGAGGDRLRRPRRLHALHRGGGRGGGAVATSSASSTA